MRHFGKKISSSQKVNKQRMGSISASAKKEIKKFKKVDNLTFYENFSANLNKHLGLSRKKKSHF